MMGNYRCFLTIIIAICLFLTAGNALAVGLVEMDSKYYPDFVSAYPDFVPWNEGPFGTGPNVEYGETWNIGVMLATRGSETYCVVNCNEWVSMREEASTDAPRIRKVYYGEEVEVIGTWHEWALATDRNLDRFGWILMQYLTPRYPTDSYDDGGYCDYDLDSDADYWYNSTELIDYYFQPFAPAIVSLGLSYDGRVNIGGDDLMVDCYTNNHGLYLMGDQDSCYTIEIQLTQYVEGYTLAGMYVGMDADEAFEAICNYLQEWNHPFTDFTCSIYEDSISADMTNEEGYPCGILAMYSNGRIDSINLYTL